LENYLDSSKEVPYNFADWLQKMNYGISYQYESILIYDMGFDNDDDLAKRIYDSDQVSFFKSLFIDGDVILYEGFADIYINEKNDN